MSDTDIYIFGTFGILAWVSVVGVVAAAGALFLQKDPRRFVKLVLTRGMFLPAVVAVLLLLTLVEQLLNFPST